MIRRLLLALALSAGAASAQWNAPQMGTFAVAALKDRDVAAKLRVRFKAGGEPLFLLGHPSSGLQQGDILRFSDKAVLVTADVWQTLAEDGALRALRAAPVVRVSAGTDPVTWTRRARLDPDPRERRLYEAGAVLLKALQENLGPFPEGQALHLSFEKGQLVLQVPVALAEQLRLLPVAGESAKEKERPAPRGRPRWVVAPPPVGLAVGSPIRWEAWAVDDSGGPTASFRYSARGRMPPGVSWDPGRHLLSGQVSDTGSWKVVFRVEDDRGRSDSLSWNSYAIVRPRIHELDTPSLNPGVLVRGRKYRWDLGPALRSWNGAGIALVSLQDSGTTSLLEGSTLGLTAVEGDRVSLLFRLRGARGADSVRVRWEVRDPRPPRFETVAGGGSIAHGERRTYRPVALDDQGRSIPVEAVLDSSAPMGWEDGTLTVDGRTPGTWAALLRARDSQGLVAEQWTTWTVQSKAPSGLVWEMEAHAVGDLLPWIATARFGHGRISVLVPDLVRLDLWSTRHDEVDPMILLGIEFLGPEAVAHGDGFSLDAGGNILVPAPGVVTGGVAGRLRGRVDHRPDRPWIFEGELIGWVRQALLAIDTSRIRAEVRTPDGGIDLPAFLETYSPSMKRILDRAYSRDNAVFLTRVEGWRVLPLGFQLGVGYMRQDWLVHLALDQYVSCGLRWGWTGRWGRIEATERVGIGAGPTRGLASWGQLGWTFGILP